jgi:hypothetical protein
MGKREAQIILKTDEQQGGARTRPRRKIRREINWLGREPGLPRRRQARRRGQDRPLGVRAELVDVAAGERAISAIAVSMLTHTLSPTRCDFPSVARR